MGEWFVAELKRLMYYMVFFIFWIIVFACDKRVPHTYYIPYATHTQQHKLVLLTSSNRVSPMEIPWISANLNKQCEMEKALFWSVHRDFDLSYLTLAQFFFFFRAIEMFEMFVNANCSVYVFQDEEFIFNLWWYSAKPMANRLPLILNFKSNLTWNTTTNTSERME